MAAQNHRPIKGILKNKSQECGAVPVRPEPPRQYSAEDEQSKKSQKWDEMNILATYHPSDKDYGLMKIDEPSTPYHRMVGEDDEGAVSDSEDNEELTADILAKKLAAAEGLDPKVLADEDESSEEEEELTPEEKEKKREFEMKRKHHYNEGMNIKLARQLIAKELAGEDEEEDEEMQDVGDSEEVSTEMVDEAHADNGQLLSEQDL
ncbi:protein phosphatase inhibitor 2 isoform X1 [Rhinatrema bivittatum]|uniref:protein phosphatase inhibitor 2 isoform X1 n=1 Tax=Rhinatrema bivittatum TaxID=194408 RepID=UPI00112C624C|nr:protein phosphatase inhibitor 2 isoform X1 [Rhinatrema bivittatum]